MKHVLKNSALVLILAGLFALPISGFGFLRLESSKPEVLGSQSPSVNLDPVVYIDQIDLSLHLNNVDEEQKFYNVIPEEYLGEGYTFMPIYQKTLKEAGITIEFVENELTSDIVVNLNQEELQIDDIDIAILILKE